MSVIQRGSESIQARNAIFMWFQLFIEILLRMHHKGSDRKELIDLCKKSYEGNDEEMKIIEEFQAEYKPDKAIWWYTRDSCFYRMMNKALRVQDYGTLLAFRFLITDIAKQIKHAHDDFIRNGLSRDTFRVYRGQLIGDDELKLIRRSMGEYLSMNSFLSTSRDRTVALEFARNSPAYHRMQPVLIEIEINPRLNTKAFADVTEMSYFEEEEVLLMLGSLFCIDNVSENRADKVLVITLSLASEQAFELQDIFAHMKEEISSDTDLDSLGKILLQMGEYEAATRIYDRVLKETEMTLSNVHARLGNAHTYRKDCKRGREHHQTSLNLRLKLLGERDPTVALSHRLTGTTFSRENNYTQALACYKTAMNIQESQIPQDRRQLSKTYHSMATVYQSMNQSGLALTFYQKALDMHTAALPTDHPDIALIYNNLGSLYKADGSYKIALECYEKALETGERVLMPDHETIQRAKRNIEMLKRSVTTKSG